VQRIVVGGSSGAGKTTLASRIADELDMPFTELDSFFHGPGWTKRPTFVADVTAFIAQDRWVTVSLGYPALGDLLWDRADTLVWLDYPRWLCETRVVRRSLARGLLRRKLWNGNRESLTRMVRDPEHPVRWSWQHYDEKRRLVLDRIDNPRWAHLTVVPLRSPADTDRWMREHVLAGS
jgi:adenylate kinase family enzyme